GGGRRTNLDPPIFVHLADAYRKEGLLEDAVRTCRDGLAAHPSCASGRLILAQALLEGGSLDTARQECEQVLAQEPDHPEAREFLTAISARQQPAGQAGAWKGDPLASPTLAALYAAQGHRTAAEAIYRELGLTAAGAAATPSVQGILERLLALREVVRRLRAGAPRLP
ncbi:MAG TPA: tetratricopeptide repeat protein, partial [Candidatus Acidoferrum sp.]|nr:tetratricopeptide repeat protein [Candidatus Acidoferrum sp.]